jgi:glycosyltransferase involved in cell wall biosynthesis
MQIAFDAFSLATSKKTGIAYCSIYTIKEMQKEYKDNFYIFNLFCIRNRKDKVNRLNDFIDKSNSNISVCYGVSYFLYMLINKIIPIPYSIFFPKQAQVTHFFDFFIPPGVNGKKVVTIYDMVFMAYPETMQKSAKLVHKLNNKISCKRADKIITISQFSKNEIIRYLNIDPEKIVIIPCGVDTEIYHPLKDVKLVEDIKKKYNVEAQYFLYLGTLEPRKNIERLIKAYKILKVKYPNAPKLVLAGGRGWLYKSIFEEIHTQKLENDVISLGYIPTEDIVPLYCGAIAFLFPSLYEGFGLPPLEAMACGVPVLTSNTSSLPEVVGDAALTVDPMKIEEIALGMERLLSDKNLRNNLSLLGIQRAKMFSWTNAAIKTIELYKNLVIKNK